MSEKQPKQRKAQAHRSFGMIDQLPSGKWRARYPHPVTKERLPVPGSPFETKTEAQTRLAVMEAEIFKQEWHDPKKGDVVFADHVEHWLKTSIGKNGAVKEETTRDLDRRNADRWLLRELNGPTGTVDLRRYKIRALTPTALNSWYAAVLAEAAKSTIDKFTLTSPAARNRAIRQWARANGHEVKDNGRISPAVVAAWEATGARLACSPRMPVEPGRGVAGQAYRMLKAILNNAVAEGLIPSNPLNIKGAGKVKKRKDAPTATGEQVFALALTMPPHYLAVVLVAAFSGLRYGELFGLRRRDVDFAAGTVRVDKPMKKVKGQPLQFGKPKTQTSERPVSMPPEIMNALAFHMEQFTNPEADALVFTTSNGNPVYSGSFGKIVRDRMAKVGMPLNMHWHDLRETSAHLAFEAGMNAQAVSDRLGHADNRTTSEFYQRWSDERDVQAIARMNAQITSAGFQLPHQFAAVAEPQPVP